MYILGISAYFHDSAACLLKDDTIIAAAQEERFSRIKNDEAFPIQAITYCLREAGIKLTQVDYVVFYEKPFLKFERLIETYLATAPWGLFSYLKAIPLWIKDKIFMKKQIILALKNIAPNWEYNGGNLLFTEHHQAHAASAFFPSPYQKAIVLTVDGVGEWATTSVWRGNGNSIELIKEIKFPHSVGLLYAAFTYYLGFKVNSDEYKVMGLAPYGEPRYEQLIYDQLIDLKHDGSFRLQMAYFNYMSGLTMTNTKFEKLFGHKTRKKDEEITRFHMDIASSIQKVTETIMRRMVKHIKQEYQADKLCLAGGVALNCVANGKLLEEFPFNSLWIQPAAGDAGGALGAAYFTYYHHLKHERLVSKSDKMQNALLGPSYSTATVAAFLTERKIKFRVYNDEAYFQTVAGLINQGKVIGWFNGRMEFGPRALGARSIIADSRNENMQATINQKIKFRESFRPFAPAVLEEHADTIFQLTQKSPYMLLVAPVKHKYRLISTSDTEERGFGMLARKRSVLPAVTHVDFSARIQTVSDAEHPVFYHLINTFFKLTGCPVIVNTSFNVKDEPIVCTPQDALNCFLQTEMDILAIENIIIDKGELTAADLNTTQSFK
ncbi:carbamoyltransferase [Mucilaginibacter pineti]|uniref:Carbamoyltransferase n=1 Tax=Mucilaginibacter pineti TaxID=1391627 RepID=A0A1G6U2F4_9SPHI|nr:carbamoyltransferase [Mucilaginibacter pineti]SDD34767.1 carbamoyltransferase [Mucilaginibacter pineti]